MRGALIAAPHNRLHPRPTSLCPSVLRPTRFMVACLVAPLAVLGRGIARPHKVACLVAARALHKPLHRLEFARLASHRAAPNDADFLVQSRLRGRRRKHQRHTMNDATCGTTSDAKPAEPTEAASWRRRSRTLRRVRTSRSCGGRPANETGGGSASPLLRKSTSARATPSTCRRTT